MCIRDRDKSRSSSGQTVTLSGRYSEVKQVVGSNFSDVIAGNELPNILNGGLGSDHLKGGNGADTYIVQSDSGIKTIDNFASDNEEDVISIGISYINISVKKVQSDLILNDSTDHTTTQVTLSLWFRGPKWQHAIFISKDYIRFTVMKDAAGTVQKLALTIDVSGYSPYLPGVVVDLSNPQRTTYTSINSEIADEIKTVFDSPRHDHLVGNRLGNFFTCTGGHDTLEGNGGRDTYVVKKSCLSAFINNYDPKGDHDMLLFDCPFASISLTKREYNLIISCKVKGHRTINVTLKQFFGSKYNQHIMVKTSDKITSFLPATKTELDSSQGQLYPFQVEKSEDCGGVLHEMNLSTPQFSKCERFVAKASNCSYTVIGNSLNNFIDPGPGNPYGYQHLKGGNGTDTYVIGHRYGTLNEIDNYAEDKQVDHLQFKVLFHDIKVSRNKMDVTLSSLSSNNSVQLKISNYFLKEDYQHLLVHSADGVVFKFSENFPYIEVIMVDYSVSKFSQIISADQNSTFRDVKVIIGSKTAENHIKGGKNTTKIIGGNNKDTIIGGTADSQDLIGLDGDDLIIGGPGNDIIYGGKGNDVINGGSGNDIIYAGMGADVINGSSGANTVIFSGYSYMGVHVNLQLGLGWDADAEGDSYEHISNILGSEYNDTLVGNDENNIIRGHGGSDVIVPAGGDDILSGGAGIDTYYLNDASGHKLIVNFAADEVTDVIVLNKTLWKDTCYHFLGNDLQMNVLFSSTDAVKRLLLNKDFLMLTIPFWLENTTYQHVAFSFLDTFKRASDFVQNGRQLQPMMDLINNGSLHLTARANLREIHLSFNPNSPNLITTTDHAKLQYIHVQPTSITYHPLKTPLPKVIKFVSPTDGTEHSFAVMLHSCNLTIAMSPLVSTTTPPSPPRDVKVVSRYFDGFVLKWTIPMLKTNPFVYDYNYVVEVSKESNGKYSEFTTSGTNFSTYNLFPNTKHYVSVCSKFNNITGCSIKIEVSTTAHGCSNLLSVPSHVVIKGFKRNKQAQIIVYLSCVRGYSLVGNDVIICNDTRSSLPKCNVKKCSLPHITQAVKLKGPNAPKHGDTVQWRCLNGFWIKHLVTNFSSTCLEGSWSPPVKLTCKPIPTCPHIILPPGLSFSPVQSTYKVGDTLTYKCTSGYTLSGPTRITCSWNENERNPQTFWSPPSTTNCSPLKCPSLLPQSHGQYSPQKPHYYTGDAVYLTCNDGYYARDSASHPEKIQLHCNVTDWSPRQRHCRLIIKVSVVRNGIEYVEVTASYAVSSLSSTPVAAKYFHLACKVAAGDSYIRFKQQDRIIHCYRKKLIAYGPNQYNGILTVSTPYGQKNVCVTGNTYYICAILGYKGFGYTTSIYRSAVPIRTTLTISPPSSSVITPSVSSCYDRVSCKKMCDRLRLPNGKNCSYNLEGQTCHFACNPGHRLVGSSSLTCKSNGRWSGDPPKCDGEWLSQDQISVVLQYKRSNSVLVG